MKNLQICIVFIFLAQTAFSQVTIADSRLLEIKLKIENEVTVLKKQLDSMDYDRYFKKQLITGLVNKFK